MIRIKARHFQLKVPLGGSATPLTVHFELWRRLGLRMSLVPYQSSSWMNVSVTPDSVTTEHEGVFERNFYAVRITPMRLEIQMHRGGLWKSPWNINNPERMRHHERALGSLTYYVPFYVAVKQVMRRLPSELEQRVYEFM